MIRVPPPLSMVTARAMEIVKETPLEEPEAVRFQTMCDKLKREFPLVPDKRIHAVIEFYVERRGLIHGSNNTDV